MKKNILAKLMTVAMVATMCMTFTACGGDSDDDDLNNGMSGSTTTWVEPYLRWDATLDQIKADMATQGWTAQVSEGNILQYGNNSRYPGVTMNMGVLNSRTNTLSTSQVAYMNVPSDFFNKILSEVVTRYNATWESTGRIYSGKGVANDKDVSITVTNAASTVLVQFVRR